LYRKERKEGRFMGSATKKFVKNFVKNRIPGGKKYPFFGSIETTRRCNSRCSFCPIGNERAEFKKGEMTIEQMKHVIDQFAEMNILAVSYLGGEPMLKEGLPEVAKYASTKDIISQVSTNGILLEENAKEWTDAFNVIVVSLDAVDADLYREIRNVDKFDQVVRGIKKAVELTKGKEGKSIIVNTVICAKNLHQVKDVVKFAKDLGVNGIMVDFATFHDYWVNITDNKSKYQPDVMDWRNKAEETKALIKDLIKMRKNYPIITSRSYMETFLTGNFKYKCHPYLFCCVNKEGAVAIPCWDSKITKFYDILEKHRLKELWFSKEVLELRKKVENCSDCYMHCIVEPSKVLGNPLSNLQDLMDWIKVWKMQGKPV